MFVTPRALHHTLYHGFSASRTGIAPSASSFFIRCSLSYSATRFCLKYFICVDSSSVRDHTVSLMYIPHPSSVINPYVPLEHLLAARPPARFLRLLTLQLSSAHTPISLNRYATTHPTRRAIPLKRIILLSTSPLRITLIFYSV